MCMIVVAITRPGQLLSKRCTGHTQVGGLLHWLNLTLGFWKPNAKHALVNMCVIAVIACHGIKRLSLPRLASLGCSHKARRPCLLWCSKMTHQKVAMIPQALLFQLRLIARICAAMLKSWLHNLHAGLNKTAFGSASRKRLKTAMRFELLVKSHPSCRLNRAACSEGRLSLSSKNLPESVLLVVLLKW